MFTLNDDLSIYATRGDIVFFSVSADEDGKPYKFQAGDVLRIKVYGKKDAEDVVLQKDFPVTEITENVEIFLTEEDTKIGEVISKPKDYWYEVELNPYDNPQTIIGYDEDGAKVFRLFPEGDDIPEWSPEPEDIPVVDDELDMTSTRPVQNQAVARAVASLEAGYEATHAAVAKLHVTPQMFGAIGDGEADDTEALVKAAVYCRENNTYLYVPDGAYRISEMVDLRYIDLDIRGTIIVSHHGVGLLVGDRSSDAVRRLIKIARVNHENFVEGDIGVRIVGVMNADVHFGIVKSVQLYADGDSEYSAIAYSNFHIGKCDYLEITDKPGTANIGWINENTFYNCRVMVRFSLVGNTYHHNNNVFYKPCFENATAILAKCTRNKFYDMRTEGTFKMTMDENTNLNLVDYNYFFSFPFVNNNILGITDNGVNNTVMNSTLRDMDSVLVYSMNAQSVKKNLYEIGEAKSFISANNDSVTIAKEWADIMTDAIIPVKGIRFLKANSDAGIFRFIFTPLDADKNVMNNSPLVQDGNGEGQRSDGTYNVGTDTYGAAISIIDPDVAYIKLTIMTGGSKPSFTFTNLSLWAYYHPVDFRSAAMLSDFFRSAIG